MARSIRRFLNNRFWCSEMVASVASAAAVLLQRVADEEDSSVAVVAAVVGCDNASRIVS